MPKPKIMFALVAVVKDHTGKMVPMKQELIAATDNIVFASKVHALFVEQAEEDGEGATLAAPTFVSNTPLETEYQRRLKIWKDNQKVKESKDLGKKTTLADILSDKDEEPLG